MDIQKLLIGAKEKLKAFGKVVNYEWECDGNVKNIEDYVLKVTYLEYTFPDPVLEGFPTIYVDIIKPPEAWRDMAVAIAFFDRFRINYKLYVQDGAYFLRVYGESEAAFVMRFHLSTYQYGVYDD